jgi:hypothetical protein
MTTMTKIGQVEKVLSVLSILEIFPDPCHAEKVSLAQVYYVICIQDIYSLIFVEK